MSEVQKLSNSQQLEFLKFDELEKSAFIPITLPYVNSKGRETYLGKKVATVYKDQVISWLAFLRLKNITDGDCCICMDKLYKASELAPEYLNEAQRKLASFVITILPDCAHLYHNSCHEMMVQDKHTKTPQNNSTVPCYECNSEANPNNVIYSDNPTQAYHDIIKNSLLTNDQLKNLGVSDAIIDSLPELKEQSKEQFQKLLNKSSEETQKAIAEQEALQKKLEQDKIKLELETIASIQQQEQESQKKNIAEGGYDSDAKNNEQVKYDVSFVTSEKFFTIINANYKELKKALKNNPEVYQKLFKMCQDKGIIHSSHLTRINKANNVNREIDLLVEHIHKTFRPGDIPLSYACRLILAFLLENGTLTNKVSDLKANSDLKPATTNISETSKYWEAEKAKPLEYYISISDFKEVSSNNYMYLYEKLIMDPEIFTNTLDEFENNDCFGRGVRYNKIEIHKTLEKQVNAFLIFCMSQIHCDNTSATAGFKYLVENNLLERSVSKQKQSDGTIKVSYLCNADTEKTWLATREKKTQEMNEEVLSSINPIYDVSDLTQTHLKQIIKNNFGDLLTNSKNNPEIFSDLLDDCIAKNLLSASYINKNREINNTKLQIDDFILHAFTNYDKHKGHVDTEIAYKYILVFLLEKGMITKYLSQEAQADGKIKIRFVDPSKAESNTKVAERNIAEESKSWTAEKSKKDFVSVSYDFRKKFLPSEDLLIPDFYDLIKDSYSNLKEKFIKNPNAFEYILATIIEEQTIDNACIKQLSAYDNITSKIDYFLNYFSKRQKTQVERSFSCLRLLQLLVAMDMPLNNMTIETRDDGKYRVSYKKPQAEVKTIAQPEINKPAEAPKPKKDFTQASDDFEDKYTPAEHFAIEDLHGIIHANYIDLKKTLIENEDVFEYILNKCIAKGIFDANYKNVLSNVSTEDKVINFINSFVILDEIKFNREDPFWFIVKLLIDMKLLPTKTVQKETNNEKIEIYFADNKPETKTIPTPEVQKPEVKATPQPTASNIAQSIKPAEAKKPSVQKNNVFKEDKYVISENITLEDFYSIMKNSYEKLKKELITNSDLFDFILNTCVEKEFIDENHAEKMYSKNTETNVNLFLDYFNQPQKVKAASKVTCLPKMCGTKKSSSELHLALNNTKKHRAAACSFVLKFLVDQNMLVNNIIKQEKANGKFEISFTKNKGN